MFKDLKVDLDERKSSSVVTDIDAIRQRTGISSDGLVIVAAILGNEVGEGAPPSLRIQHHPSTAPLTYLSV